MDIVGTAFSGIGVKALEWAAPLINHFRGNRKAHQRSKEQGYVAPKTLSTFTHSAIQEGTTVVQCKARRILTIKGVQDVDCAIVKYPVFTSGKRSSAVSLSDPDTMTLWKSDEEKIFDFNEIRIRPLSIGKTYIVASESVRHVDVFKWGTAPNPSDTVMYGLHKNVLWKRKHEGIRRDFVGSRMICVTESAKLIVEFDSTFCPEVCHPVLIDTNGEIYRGDHSDDFIMPRRVAGKKTSVFICSTDFPPADFGFYLWWEWPKV